MTAAQSLVRAWAILAGEVFVPDAQRVPTAGHVARTALETAVTQALLRRGHDLTGARLTSRFIALTALVSRETAAVARHTWVGLSRACHRHSFELPPSEQEICGLITRVEQVLEQLDQGATAVASGDDQSHEQVPET